MAFRVTQRERRWLYSLLILATIAAAFVVVGFLGSLFFYLGDIVLVFFLAWLLAFILSPVVAGMERIPRLPRVAAVVVVYTVLVGALIVLVVIIAQALTTSIAEFIAGVPQLRSDLPTVLKPWQDRLDAIGLTQVDLVAQGQAFLDNLNDYAAQLVDPLRQLAVASLGALGNLLIVIILSLYMVVDRDRIVSFLFRLVPPGYALEARLLETSVARSFGGFLRGQAAMGIIYGFVGAAAGILFGLGYLPVVATASGVLMVIPFFGLFVSWLPPVLVGSKVGGIAGAIFGIPIAAVVSAFFFHFLSRTRESGSVAHRAAKRLAVREGREVRVPVEPAPGIDPDVDELPSPMARPLRAPQPDAGPGADQ